MCELLHFFIYGPQLTLFGDDVLDVDTVEHMATFLSPVTAVYDQLYRICTMLCLMSAIAEFLPHINVGRMT